MENKPKRLVKGSEEAKEHMANLRSKRGSKKPIEVTPIEQPIEPPIEKPIPKSRSRKNLSVDFP
jgi:hypothetical protein